MYEPIPIKSYGGIDDGVTDASPAFDKAIADATKAGTGIRVEPGTYYIGKDVSCTVPIKFEDGGMLSIPSGVTFTISSRLSADDTQQIVTGGGTLTIDAGACSHTTPQWWGATGDDSTDNYTPFLNSFTSTYANGGVGYVRIPAGTYQIGTSLEDCWGRGGVWSTGGGGLVLEGAGQSHTIIKYTGTTGFVFPIQSTTTNMVNNFVVKGMKFLAPNLAPESYLATTDLEYDDVGGAIRVTGATNTIKDCAFSISTGTAVSVEPKNNTETNTYTYDGDIEFTTTGAGASEKYAIEITAQSGHVIKKVIVPLKRLGTPGGTIHAEIWTDDGGTPNAPSAQVSDKDSASLDIDTKIGTSLGNYTFLWNRGEGVSTGTTYWIVLETVGYTNSAGNKLYLGTDADGTTGGTAAYDFGVGWNTSNDGADHVFVEWFGQPLMNRMENCYINQATTDGTGVRIQKNAQIYIDQSYIEGIPAIYGTGGGIHAFISNSFIQGDAYKRLIDWEGGYITVSSTYIEGDVALGDDDDLTALKLASFIGCFFGGRLTWSEGITEPYVDNCMGPHYASANPTLTPDRMWHMIYGATHFAWQAGGTGSPSLGADANALDGNRWILNGLNERCFLQWSLTIGTDEYGQLPRGTYEVTIYAYDTDGVAGDCRIEAQYSNAGSWTDLAETDFTLSSDRYRPYTILLKVGSWLTTDRMQRIRIAKATGTSNTIYISHFTVEYRGPDIVNDRGLTLFSHDMADTVNSRRSSLRFLGQRSGGEQDLMARIQASHYGDEDDGAGKLGLWVNSGAQGHSPDQGIEIDASGNVEASGMLTTVAYTNATRPPADSVTPGAMIFNTDDGFPNWSTGSNWVEADGSVT